MAIIRSDQGWCMRRLTGVLVVVIAAAACSAVPGMTADRTSPTGAPVPASTAPESLPPALAHRAAHSMTPLPDGSLLLAGGCVEDGCSVATASTYVVRGATAEPAEPMRQARDAHSAVALADGRVLVAGGFEAEGTAPLRSAEVYDSRSGRWDVAGSLAVGRGGHAAARLGDGRVIVAGGWVGPRRYTTSTEIFDPRTNTFTAGPDLPRALLGIGAAALADGSVLLAGGQTGPTTASGLAVRVTTTGELLQDGRLGTPRYKHGVVVLASGEALVIGGTTDDSDMLATTEIFDLRTKRFRPGPNLRVGRYKLSALVLPDGRVFVIGGSAGAEVLDPVAATSETVDALGPTVASFATVGVTGGYLRVIGGYDAAIRLSDVDLSLPLAKLT